MRKATILIVEDDAILALDLQRMLARQGYTIAGPLTSGEGALAFIADKPVDLILMDIELAGAMNGIAAAGIIHRTVGVPVVFLTGFSQDPLIEQAKIAAPYGYLIKPVTERELSATLETALHRHMLDRRLKETMAELRESEQNYKTLTESGQILIWTSGEDTLCDYCNTIWLEFTGRTLQQERGNGWLENVHADDRQGCLDIYIGAFERREKFNMEFRLRRHDGHYHWMLDEGGPRYNSQGKFIGYIGHCLDITERKRAEEALVKVHSELEQKVLERTADLEKTNATLAMMLDYARTTETDINERVVSNLRANILGIVDVLKKQQLTQSTLDLVELLETTTLNLAHPIARNLESQLLKLTAREIQLANFIRLGKSTKELVDLFNISKKTVESHRDNLRKKLGIHNKKINLRTFLNSEFAK
ncbi:MAG: response regulator [Desulfobulbaceae bacterium]|nr:response regulator [Desulfobulbaceae bacterium]